MGVNQTSELYKGFIFDGIDSKGFGVYISGAGVYNAPERDIEEIEIPGRNGAYMLDRGRFHNITVTYPAGLFGTDGDEFAAGIRRLRNALASRRGYCKLIDEYNPLEYRMAVYRGGLEADPAAINGENKAAQFEIQFECKPQRFLTSGETATAYASGATVTNPTLFDASPLLQVWGYGDINLNNETVIVSNVPIGRVILANAEQTGGERTYYTGNPYTFTIDPAALDTGDDIYGTYMDGNRHIGRGLTYTIYALTEPGYGPLTGTVARNSEHAFDFEYGTADTFTIVNNNQQYEILRLLDVQTITGVLKYRIEVAYDGDRTITVTPYYTGTTFTEGIQPQGILFGLGHDTVYGDSTVSALGNPLFIDLDIGEAYKEENGEIISSNTGVSLPAELPTLKAGSNTITFDNTVTQLKIVPHWWGV